MRDVMRAEAPDGRVPAEMTGTRLAQRMNRCLPAHLVGRPRTEDRATTQTGSNDAANGRPLFMQRKMDISGSAGFLRASKW